MKSQSSTIVKVKRVQVSKNDLTYRITFTKDEKKKIIKVVVKWHKHEIGGEILNIEQLEKSIIKV